MLFIAGFVMTSLTQLCDTDVPVSLPGHYVNFCVTDVSLSDRFRVIRYVRVLLFPSPSLRPLHSHYPCSVCENPPNIGRTISTIKGTPIVPNPFNRFEVVVHSTYEEYPRSRMHQIGPYVGTNEKDRASTTTPECSLVN
jgi:hypothetical protein